MGGSSSWDIATLEDTNAGRRRQAVGFAPRCDSIRERLPFRQMRPGMDLVLPERYHLGRPIGSGGAADVVLVEDRAGEPRRKALKLLRADVPRAQLDRFRSEFRLLASLSHPGLARVYEFGEIDKG